VERYRSLRKYLYGVRRNDFIFTLIIAYRIINGLRHRLILFGEVKVVIAGQALEYGAGKMQVCDLTAGCASSGLVSLIFSILIANTVIYFCNSRLCVCVCVFGWVGGWVCVSVSVNGDDVSQQRI
jgi:hypothetical protein